MSKIIGKRKTANVKQKNKRLKLKNDLFENLKVAQSQRAKGEKGKTFSRVMKDIRKKTHGSK